MATRYDAQGPQSEYEPGSGDRVLRTLMGVRSVRAMARIESEALLATTQESIDETGLDQRFTADAICHLHRTWLGAIYSWAGQYREVNVSKGGFMFAAAKQVPRLMLGFEQGPLQNFTPCRFADTEAQVRALATVHVELLLVHPFREGNGRCARLLATLMALQAGLPILDFGGVRGEEKQRYFAAVQAGMDGNYDPMQGIFRRIIARTQRLQGRATRA